MAAPGRLLLEQGDGVARVAASQLEREREPDDAAAEDEKVGLWGGNLQAWASVRAGAKSSRRRRGALNVCFNACTL